MQNIYKQTKIIATIGPISESYENLEALAMQGVDVFRLNFSHGNHKWHNNVIKKIKRLNRKGERHVAILLDTKGPEIRTGDLKSPIELIKDSELILTVGQSKPYEQTGKLDVSYDAFIDDVEVGEKILVDNGVINLKVIKKTKKDIICKVLDGGEITSRRHLNLPGKEVSLDSITEKDWEDINFGIENGVDFIALSFVRGAEDIETLHKYLAEKKSHIQVIAKIESFEATKNLDEICKISDVVMVARGDLGAEIPFSQVPRMQRKIIRLCNKYRTPVIVATHMLESMIDNPMPTRAEATDISEAVWQQSDCVMLSGETAGGKFPIKSAEVMREIILETEDEMTGRSVRPREIENDRDGLVLASALAFQHDKRIKAIFVITRSGYMAHLVSALRPNVPIFAFTNETSVRRKLQILWGVNPFKINFSSNPQKTTDTAKKAFLAKNPEWAGKKYILISDFLVNGEFVPTMQIRDL